ncbi:hypothetical protein PT285_00585 [Lactobacillus sp. ESL0791]|uniref:hypothetical protein n=1 Tax=Lactobacillus sp. ESL0791 TaxID=2983234 RepID=UPI0023F84E2C|nr:hypothetical protein [Lactobacillus sp. ESL0791]MDF7637935.1 hypothetical protein [Lactobacillus sp. ESL0791]
MIKTITSGKKELLYQSNLLNTSIYQSEYVNFDQYKIGIYDVVIPANKTFKWQNKKNNLIIILFSGKLRVNATTCGDNTSIVAPAGLSTSFIVDSKSSIHALILIKENTTGLDKTVISKHEQQIWYPYKENGHIHLYLKDILTPEQIGGCVYLIDYPETHITEWHNHTFSHGMYVLNGVYCNQSQYDQTEKYYGPGSFVFGPKGQVMRHGAAAGQHCYGIFITDKPFSLNYLSDAEVERACKNTK